jgi:hypothetical protein
MEIFLKIFSIKYYGKTSSANSAGTCGQTDTHEEANGAFRDDAATPANKYGGPTACRKNLLLFN